MEDTLVGLPLSGRLRGPGAEEAGGRAPRGGCALVWSPADVWEQRSCPFRTREPLVGPLRCEGGVGEQRQAMGNSSARIPAVSPLWDGGELHSATAGVTRTGYQELSPSTPPDPSDTLERALLQKCATGAEPEPVTLRYRRSPGKAVTEPNLTDSRGLPPSPALRPPSVPAAVGHLSCGDSRGTSGGLASACC